jgi:transposase
VEPLFDFPEAQAQKPAERTRREDARVVRAVRNQVELLPRELDSVLPEDHQARAIWSLLCKLDLSGFYSSIRAVISGPGRSATDPQVLLGLWLLATVDGVGRARELDRLCDEHDAYRWMRGGVPINYHMLSDFRTAHREALDELLTEILAAMMSAGLVTLRHVAQDGMKVRASANKGTFRREARLEQFREEARKRVEGLGKECDAPEPGVSRRQQAARERAARDREARLEQALNNLPEVKAAKERKLKHGSKAEKAKVKEPRVSTTDPEARVMKMPDGGFQPAYNLQMATDVDSQVIVGVGATRQGSDGGQAARMVEQVVKRAGVRPKAYLMDGDFAKRDDITLIEQQGIEVYAPPRLPKKGSDEDGAAGQNSDDGSPLVVETASSTQVDSEAKSIDHVAQDDTTATERQGIEVSAPAQSENKRATRKSAAVRRRRETPEVAAWRARMETEEAKKIYKERASTAECVNAQGRAHGLTQLVVRGTDKVLSVLLLVAVTHNLLRWISLTA